MSKFKLLETNIPIEYVEDEHDETKDFKPSFWYWNKRYFLEDFIRVHNNPWLCDNYPDFIQGMQADGSRDSYENPIFIELIGDEGVNIYEEVNL